MKTTSHFIWIDIKSELLSDLFSEVYLYLKQHNVESILSFQNPLSIHITLYYLEKDISKNTKKEIVDFIKDFEISESIFISWFDYFTRWKDSKYLLYLIPKNKSDLKYFRDKIDAIYDRKYILDNSYDFISHISFFKILNPGLFEKHREDIEKIIKKEIKKLENIDVNSREVFLYAVNSDFKEEIQLKIL